MSQENFGLSQSRLAAILGEATVGLSEISLKGRFQSANSEMCRILGRPFEKILQLGFSKVIHPEEAEDALLKLNHVIETGNSVSLDSRFVQPNGRTIWTNSYLTRLDDGQGRPRAILAVTIDLTARRQSEEQLRHSETSLANAQRIAQIGNWDFDIQNNQVFLSDEFYRIFGLPKGSLETNPTDIYNYFDPEYQAVVQAALDAAYTQGSSFDFENRIIRPSGEKRLVQVVGEITFDEAGEPLRMSGTIQDITERKRIEQEKAQLIAQVEFERNRLENLISNMPGVVWESWGMPGSPDQRIDFVNDYAEKLLGYSKEEWLSMSNFWHVIVHPDDQKRALQIAAENFSKGQNYSQEYRWISKDKRIVWIEANVVIIFDGNGKPVGMRGINLDITRRKQIETERDRLMAELDIEKARLRHIFDHAPAFIFTLRGPQFVFEMVNQAFSQIVGQRELIGISLVDAFPEVESQGFIDILRGVYNTGESFTGDEMPVELHSKDSDTKELRYMNFIYTALRETDNSISGILCYGIDVTEQVIARTQIQESESRYRFLFRNNPLPMWIFDADTLAFIAVNKAAIKHYGYTEAEFMNMTLNDIRPSEDVPAFLGNTKKQFPAFDKAGVYSHQKKDGTIIFVEMNSVQFNFNGKNAELVLINDVTERRKAENAMRQAETNYRNLVESSPGIVYVNEPNPPYSTIYVSPNIEVYGYSIDEWYSKSMWLQTVHKDDRERVMREFQSAALQGLETNFEYRIVAKDGSIHWWQDKARFITDENGKRISWQGVIIDITPTKELKEQLRQSQKLESVGLLAGGIAHDFNNMLTAINGYSDLTLRRLKPDDPLRKNIEEIKKAGQRSADLTRQLLAFSRQQVLQPVVLDLNEIITDTIKMLQRVIGENIQLVPIFNPKIGHVKVDPGQLSQILINLAVNARDAMPKGGKLTIETNNVFLDEALARQHLGVLAGDYVLLTISDTGTGMSDEIKQHIFEPFFTTKKVGQGTGLGLATVYGIVKQSGGTIEVSSEEGVGTSFKIYFPRVTVKGSETTTNDFSAEMPKGTETILLVEDEAILRSLAREILEDCGYTIIEASNGMEALSVVETQNPRIDLLMTDVVMPKMGGTELAGKLRTQMPDLPVLFTSGYTDDAVARHNIMDANSNFIQKPFTSLSLTSKIREILDNSSTA